VIESAYIGVGSNLGDSKGLCLEAVDRVSRLPGSVVSAVSPWYLSRPVGVDDEQSWYVNGVARIETALSPGDLLGGLLGIEKEMGRVRRKRWESRLIDLDLLLYGAEIIKLEDLEIPHPRIHTRKFVLVPLSDLDSGLIHPSFGISIGTILNELDDDTQDIIKL
jgi:2-amino-4-hydroxy-6-hydroxymethyldihydropteridine diphosphokinase